MASRVGFRPDGNGVHGLNERKVSAYEEAVGLSSRSARYRVKQTCVR